MADIGKSKNKKIILTYLGYLEKSKNLLQNTNRLLQFLYRNVYVTTNNDIRYIGMHMCCIIAKH